MPPERRNDRWAIHDPGERRPRLFLQKVPEPKTAKNRLHLDLRAAPGLEGEERMRALREYADRLVSLGARVEATVEPSPIEAGHIVLTDPEGNEFCLD